MVGVGDDVVVGVRVMSVVVAVVMRKPATVISFRLNFRLTLTLRRLIACGGLCSLS